MILIPIEIQNDIINKLSEASKYYLYKQTRLFYVIRRLNIIRMTNHNILEVESTRMLGYCAVLDRRDKLKFDHPLIIKYEMMTKCPKQLPPKIKFLKISCNKNVKLDVILADFIHVTTLSIMINETLPIKLISFPRNVEIIFINGWGMKTSIPHIPKTTQRLFFRHLTVTNKLILSPQIISFVNVTGPITFTSHVKKLFIYSTSLITHSPSQSIISLHMNGLFFDSKIKLPHSLVNLTLCYLSFEHKLDKCLIPDTVITLKTNMHLMKYLVIPKILECLILSHDNYAFVSKPCHIIFPPNFKKLKIENYHEYVVNFTCNIDISDIPNVILANQSHEYETICIRTTKTLNYKLVYVKYYDIRNQTGEFHIPYHVIKLDMTFKFCRVKVIFPESIKNLKCTIVDCEKIELQLPLMLKYLTLDNQNSTLTFTHKPKNIAVYQYMSYDIKNVIPAKMTVCL